MSAVVREGGAVPARKLSHADVSLQHGTKAVEMAERGRGNSYVVHEPGDSRKLSHAEVSALYGSDEYSELRNFHIPSQRMAQEALHRLRKRGAVAATAVDKVTLLFASAATYVAYLSWFDVIDVARRAAAGKVFVLGIDDPDASSGSLWLSALVWSAVVYGAFFFALVAYQRRCELAAEAVDEEKQADCEMERQSFGKCLSLFSKAGLFAASYAWYEAIRQSLLHAAPTTSLYAWITAVCVTLFFAAVTALLSDAEDKLEEELKPTGAAITNKSLKELERNKLVKLKVMWMMNDGITSSFAWIIALLIVSALQRSITFQFWDEEDPTKPMSPAIRRAAEWALFFLSGVFAAAVLVAKRNALLSHGTSDAFDDKADGMPCAGCRSVLCQMEAREGTGRQTKAMMKGAIVGALLGAMAGAAIGNSSFDGLTGASIGAMVGAFGLAAAGMGCGAAAYAVEQAEANNPITKGPAAFKKVFGEGLAKLEKLAHDMQESVDRAVMTESIFDELANVMSLAQQLTEEASVWLCAITLFDAVRGTFADPTTVAAVADASAMAQWGRMLIFAIALTAMGGAAAYAMQLSLEQEAHMLVHNLSDDSSVLRRELYFATDLAEIVDNAIALLVGRTWNYAILGMLTYYGTLTKDNAPIIVYAVLATIAALYLNRRIAVNLRNHCQQKLKSLPDLAQVESMTPEQSARDPLPKLLRQLSDMLSVDVDYDPKLDDPPRSKVTAIGAVFGLGLGAIIGASVGDDGSHGAVFGCLIGTVIGTIVCGGAAAAIAVILYPDASSDESGEDARGLSSDDGNAMQANFEPIQSIVHSNTNAEV